MVKRTLASKLRNARAERMGHKEDKPKVKRTGKLHRW